MSLFHPYHFRNEIMTPNKLHGVGYPYCGDIALVRPAALTADGALPDPDRPLDASINSSCSLSTFYKKKENLLLRGFKAAGEIFCAKAKATCDWARTSGLSLAKNMAISGGVGFAVRYVLSPLIVTSPFAMVGMLALGAFVGGAVAVIKEYRTGEKGKRDYISAAATGIKDTLLSPIKQVHKGITSFFKEASDLVTNRHQKTAKEKRASYMRLATSLGTAALGFASGFFLADRLIDANTSDTTTALSNVANTPNVPEAPSSLSNIVTEPKVITIPPAALDPAVIDDNLTLSEAELETPAQILFDDLEQQAGGKPDLALPDDNMDWQEPLQMVEVPEAMETLTSEYAFNLLPPELQTDALRLDDMSIEEKMNFAKEASFALFEQGASEDGMRILEMGFVNAEENGLLQTTIGQKLCSDMAYMLTGHGGVERDLQQAAFLARMSEGEKYSKKLIAYLEAKEPSILAKATEDFKNSQYDPAEFESLKKQAALARQQLAQLKPQVAPAKLAFN